MASRFKQLSEPQKLLLATIFRQGYAKTMETTKLPELLLLVKTISLRLKGNKKELLNRLLKFAAENQHMLPTVSGATPRE